MPSPYPTIIPGLRSPSDRVQGLVYFGRMLDKIRLAASGQLPEGWQMMRGVAAKGTFDWRCCRFLRVDYQALEAETLKKSSDEETAIKRWETKAARVDVPARRCSS